MEMTALNSAGISVGKDFVMAFAGRVNRKPNAWRPNRPTP
jgi:hypothetical protein